MNKNDRLKIFRKGHREKFFKGYQFIISMFRKQCPNCGEKISKNFDFCPFCGQIIGKGKAEQFQRGGGLLNEIEESNDIFDGMRLPFGFNALFNKLTREIDKQLREFDKVIGETKEKKRRIEREPTRRIVPLNNSGISISISSTNSNEPIIKVKGFGMPKEKSLGMIGGFEEPIEKTLKIKPVRLTKTQETKLAKLPREEPETKVRRLTDRVIYEIDLPGVKDKKDIIINPLENSIEIKALSKDRAFFKLIPVSLPLRRYDFEKGKLILELEPRS